MLHWLLDRLVLNGRNMMPKCLCRLPQRVGAMATKNTWAKLSEELEAQYSSQKYVNYPSTENAEPNQRYFDMCLLELAIQFVDLRLGLLYRSNSASRGKEFLGRVDNYRQKLAGPILRSVIVGSMMMWIHVPFAPKPAKIRLKGQVALFTLT